MKKTKDYDLFKFRADNRDKIDRNHVKRLVESIKTRNLLDLRPISVNAEMEVIDGQHRLLAAKELEVEIYYNIEKDLRSEDIILMNIAKVWNAHDYLNYYCKNGHMEYIKLCGFMKANNITLKIALSLTMAPQHDAHHKYKLGQYVFPQEEVATKEIDLCWDIINYIKRMNGFSSYTRSSRFWKALTKLIRHYNFDEGKFRNNLEKMVERVKSKASTADYLQMFMDIHNWRNNVRINLLEDEKVTRDLDLYKEVNNER